MKIHRNIKIGQHDYKILIRLNKKQKLNILHFPKQIKIWPNYQKQIIKFTKFKKMQRKISLLQPAGPK